MIVNIVTKYNEGKIEAPEWLLSTIAFYVSKGANHLALVGCNVHAKEAREISRQILDALREKVGGEKDD
ncbi:MAG: hypothetical protein ACI4W2_11535 [Eubacterium sp.]